MKEYKPIFFSVVIPLYNKEKYIKRSVNSVLNQSYKNFELIIINDASTDSSIKKLQKYSDPRIKIYHRDKPGPGGYAARNLGIRKAKADYISFLDADDEWMSDYLKVIHDLICKYKGIKCLCTSYIIKYSENKNKYCTYYLTNKSIKNKIIDKKEFFLSVSSGKPPIHTSTITIKKEVFLYSGNFPEGKCRRGGDIETWMRIALREKIAWSSFIGAIYYQDIPNQVTQIESNLLPPYVVTSVHKLLGTTDSFSAILLKKYANHYIYLRMVKALKRGLLSRELINSYFKEIDRTKYLLFLLLYLFPKFFVKLSFLLYARIKKTIKIILKR